MKFAAVSTFNADGFMLYGRRMMESFHQNWPNEVPLRVYSEGWSLIDSRTEIVELDDASPWLGCFKSRNKHRTFRDFRWDAVRFSHKVAAVSHAARDIECDVLIWLDGDIYTHAQITLADLEKLAPAENEWISWLNRTQMYPECGFYMLNLRHPQHLEYLSAFEAMYVNDELYRLDEFHDSYVLQQVVKRTGALSRSLSGRGVATSHPLVNGPLGQWFDHLKGSRKQDGKSRRGDLKVARQEDYWK